MLFNGKLNPFISIFAFLLFITILTYNTYLYYVSYIEACSLSSPCWLIVFSVSENWKGVGFVGYCANYLMLKTLEVYIKDCTIQTDHSVVVNIMLVFGLFYILYIGVKAFKEIMVGWGID